MLRHWARFLAGDGIELGPGHAPFQLLYAGTNSRYVDRWQPEQNRALFPELGPQASFPKPHIVSDLNVDKLTMLGDASQDFVIASHVLEHLADPLGQLEEIHRVLRPGGVALILLPDRRRTLDHQRPPTSVEHLIADHEARVVAPDDAHVEEFLRCGGGWNDAWDADERVMQFELQRQRSFHVHCWTEDEFSPALRYAIVDMGLQWELLDALFLHDVPDSIEFGYMLRRATSHADPIVLGERFDEVRKELFERRSDSERRAAEATQLRAELDAIRSHPAFRLAARARRAVRAARSRLVRAR